MSAGTPVYLRIPEEMQEFIREDAKNNNRQISQEINYLIGKARLIVEEERRQLEAIRSGGTQIDIEALRNARG